MRSGLIFVFVLLYSIACFGINFTTSTLEESLIRANSENKKIFVFYSADWCIPCVIMKETVFTDGKINEIVDSESIAVLVHYDESNPTDWTNKYDVKCLPTSMVLDSKGNVISKYEGGMGVQRFISFFRNETKIVEVSTYMKNAEFDSSKNLDANSIQSENKSLEGKIYLDGKLVDAFSNSGGDVIKSSASFDNKRSKVSKTNSSSENLFKYVIQFGAFNTLEEVKLNQNIMQEKIDIETIIFVDSKAETYQYKLISKNRYESRQVNEVVKEVKSRGHDCFPKML